MRLRRHRPHAEYRALQGKLDMDEERLPAPEAMARRPISPASSPRAMWRTAPTGRPSPPPARAARRRSMRRDTLRILNK